MDSLNEEFLDAVGMVDVLFTEHTLLGNLVTAAVYLSLADILVQFFYERRQFPDNWRLDVPRILKSGVLGVLMALIGSYWYMFLDSTFPTTDKHDVGAKVILDQIFGGSFFCTLYIFGMGIMEGYSLTECFREWTDKFPAIYKTDWLFWPTSQAINFAFVQDKYRVLYVNVATFVWNIFLSYYRHRMEITTV